MTSGVWTRDIVVEYMLTVLDLEHNVSKHCYNLLVSVLILRIFSRATKKQQELIQ